MATLKRDDIVEASDIEIRKVPTPEWGQKGDKDAHVYVKGLDGQGVSNFNSSLIVQKGKERRVSLTDIHAKLCVRTICDETGKLLFSESDVAMLTKKSGAPLVRCFKVAQELSGLGDDDIKDIAEELRADPLEDSASD